MVCVVIRCAEGDLERALARAAFADLAGVEEEALDRGVRLWLRDAGDADELCARLTEWQPQIERVDEQRDWNEAWQSQWTPHRVGERFYLVSPEDGSATPEGRLRLAMHRGTAFGNGDHATTHLCLMAMEHYLRPGDVFLDVGCGSGLLGEAARALGAGRVYGCDLDIPALRRGAFAGSVEAVRSASCDFLAANINLGVLLDLLPDIARVLRPDRRVVLSGVLEDQAATLAKAAQAAGLKPSAPTILDGWASIVAAVS